MSLPWLSDPRRPLTSPREIPKLEAWFDALDTRTVLNGAGATISDNELVKTWVDKSGNTGRNLANATEANRPYYYTKLADGLVFDGTAGATATLGSTPSGDQTWAFWVDIPASNPPASIGIFAAGGSYPVANGLSAYIFSSGAIYIDKFGANTATDYRSASIAGFVASYAGQRILMTLTIASNVLTVAVNGATVAYVESTGAGTNPNWGDAVGSTAVFIGKLENAGTYYNGTLRPLIYNRALSSGEIAALAAGVEPSAADYPSQVAGTALITGDNSDFDTDTGWWTQTNATIAAGSATISANGNIRRPGLLTVGTRYRATYTVSSVTGAGYFSDSAKAFGVFTTAGTASFEFVAGGTEFSAACNPGNDAVLDSVTLIPLGLLLSSDTAQPAAGLKWYDTSGNSATITLPASGVTWSGVATKPGLWFDDDYLKSAAFSLSQPTTVYLVLSQYSWTLNDILIDGDSNGGGQIFQDATTPTLSQYSGAIGASTTSVPLKTNAVMVSVIDGASSLLRVGRGVAGTGNPGAANMGGLTLGAAGNGASPANITVSEVVIFAGAHDTATQNRVIQHLGRKWGIAV